MTIATLARQLEYTARPYDTRELFIRVAVSMGIMDAASARGASAAARNEGLPLSSHLQRIGSIGPEAASQIEHEVEYRLRRDEDKLFLRLAVEAGLVADREVKGLLAEQKRKFAECGRLGRIDVRLANKGRLDESARIQIVTRRDAALVRSMGPAGRVEEEGAPEIFLGGREDEGGALRERFRRFHAEEERASRTNRRRRLVQHRAGAAGGTRTLLAAAASVLVLVGTSIVGFVATREETSRNGARDLASAEPAAQTPRKVRSGQSVCCYGLVPADAPIQVGGRQGTILHTRDGLTVWAVDESGSHRELFESLAERRRTGQGRILLKVEGSIRPMPAGSAAPAGAEETIFLSIDTASPILYDEYAGVADPVQIRSE